MELLRAAATNLAAVRVDHAKLEAQASKDRRVGGMHGLVALFETGLVDVEGVSILHNKFPRAHHAETRPDLVPEFHLYLVQVDGQLLVALQLPSRNVSHDLLVGRAEAEVALVTVFHPQEQVTVLVPASRLLPQLRRLHCRHDDFEGAGAVHFLSHDRLDLAKDPQAERHPGKQARGKAPDQASTKHQLVADDFCFCGGIP